MDNISRHVRNKVIIEQRTVKMMDAVKTKNAAVTHGGEKLAQTHNKVV